MRYMRVRYMEEYIKELGVSRSYGRRLLYERNFEEHVLLRADSIIVADIKGLKKIVIYCKLPDIVNYLTEPKTVELLSKLSNIPPSTLRYQLSKLEFIQTKKVGKKLYYYVEPLKYYKMSKIVNNIQIEYVYTDLNCKVNEITYKNPSHDLCERTEFIYNDCIIVAPKGSIIFKRKSNNVNIVKKLKEIEKMISDLIRELESESESDEISDLEELFR